jgi:hypothetical protein
MVHPATSKLKLFIKLEKTVPSQKINILLFYLFFNLNVWIFEKEFGM